MYAYTLLPESDSMRHDQAFRQLLSLTWVFYSMDDVEYYKGRFCEDTYSALGAVQMKAKAYQNPVVR